MVVQFDSYYSVVHSGLSATPIPVRATRMLSNQSNDTVLDMNASASATANSIGGEYCANRETAIKIAAERQATRAVKLTAKP